MEEGSSVKMQRRVVRCDSMIFTGLVYAPVPLASFTLQWSVWTASCGLHADSKRTSIETEACGIVLNRIWSLSRSKRASGLTKSVSRVEADKTSQPSQIDHRFGFGVATRVDKEPSRQFIRLVE